jgi:selenocysteine-specific elongation factor
MKNIIVGTAGHIDHGKTALVKALTGIDADRLKEEKQRGITIDIGFADLVLGDFRFGFVDVPGHERFVKNMLAGAHGIDLVMLVVAADESVMPQTREHFDICRLLHVKSGLVAITKSDLVDPDLLALARSEIEEYLAGSFLESAPVIPVSSRTGEGIDQLKQALASLASTTDPKTTLAVPRLPIDRAFSIKGFGTVVTGTLIAGEIHSGDDLEVLPSKIRTRVRNIQVHGSDTNVAVAGQRTAINLQGLNLDQVQRGTVLAPPDKLRSTSIIDARLDILSSAPRALAHRARVRLHHSTAEVMARVVVLGQAQGAPRGVEPGGSDLVQLRLEEPITALPGDRFIIRSYSPQVTIGGGIILDPFAGKHRLRDLDVVDRLVRLETADPERRVLTFLESAGSQGLTSGEIASRTGATDTEIGSIARDLILQQKAVEVSNNPLTLLASATYRDLANEVINLLEAHHKREPLSLGMSREEVRERVFGRARPEIFRAVVSGLVSEGKVVSDRDSLRLASHRPAFSEAEAAAKERLEAAFKQAGLQAASLEETAQRVGIAVELARKLYNLLLAERRILRLGELVYHVDTIEQLKERVRAQKAVNPRMDVAVFKEITGGLTRKYAIPLLEFLDRERVTRRIGNEREIL